MSTYKSVVDFLVRCLTPERLLTENYYNLDGIIFISCCTILNPLFLWLFDIKYKFIIITFWVLRYVNYRIRSGPIRTQFKKSVLITGGSHGLGKSLVREFSSKDDIDQVIILDIDEPDLMEENCRFIKTDFTNDKPSDIVRNIEKIISINEIGVIIINAGMRQESNIMDQKDLTKILKVNWLTQYSLLNQILFRKINSKAYTHVVGVSSVLGFLAPANLGVYSSTKAAMLNTLDSMRQEVPRDLLTVSTIIPGQLDTRMFNDKKVNKFLGPVICKDKLSKRIGEIVDLSLNGEFIYPFYGNVLPIIKSMPYTIQILARKLSGVDVA